MDHHHHDTFSQIRLATNLYEGEITPILYKVANEGMVKITTHKRLIRNVATYYVKHEGSWCSLLTYIQIGEMVDIPSEVIVNSKTYRVLPVGSTAMYKLVGQQLKEKT